VLEGKLRCQLWQQRLFVVPLPHEWRFCPREEGSLD
jgi:hypothetical protein